MRDTMTLYMQYVICFSLHRLNNQHDTDLRTEEEDKKHAEIINSSLM